MRPVVIAFRDAALVVLSSHNQYLFPVLASSVLGLVVVAVLWSLLSSLIVASADPNHFSV
jgi:hypothetical protein